MYRESNEYWIEIEKHSKLQIFNQGNVYFVLEILFPIEPVLLFFCLPFHGNSAWVGPIPALEFDPSYIR